MFVKDRPESHFRDLQRKPMVRRMIGQRAGEPASAGRK